MITNIDDEQRMMTGEMQKLDTVTSEDETPDGVKDDILWGAAAIGEFIDAPERQTRYKLEQGLIPAGRIGRGWVGSKRRIRKYYERITAGGIA